MPLNPALDRYPAEAMTIGHCVLSYGELELMVALLLGNALRNRDAALRMMFRVVGESARIGAADAMMRDAYAGVGLAAEYAEAIGSVRFCIRVRNQFAHCHWGDHITAGLFFTDLQDPAKASEGFQHYWDHIDVALALRLRTYFEYARECLLYVEYEFVQRSITAKGAEPRLSHPFSMPTKSEQPPLHNPPELHIPPWLSEDEKRQHVARALAAKGGPPTPTPAQKAQDAARQAKRDRKQADRERDVAKRSDPEPPKE